MFEDLMDKNGRKYKANDTLKAFPFID